MKPKQSRLLWTAVRLLFVVGGLNASGIIFSDVGRINAPGFDTGKQHQRYRRGNRI